MFLDFFCGSFDLLLVHLRDLAPVDLQSSIHEEMRAFEYCTRSCSITRSMDREEVWGRTVSKLPRKPDERGGLPAEWATEPYNRHSIQSTGVPLHERIDEVLFPPMSP